MAGFDLHLPLEGSPISPAPLAYVSRASAESQAVFWNDHLIDDPEFGPSSGFRVGCGPRMDGRYPLVWVRADPFARRQTDAVARPLPEAPPIALPSPGGALNRHALS